jgi:hypothetical protein
MVPFASIRSLCFGIQQTAHQSQIALGHRGMIAQLFYFLKE